ncbi:MAG: 50S ribosomal protein L16 [Candidatus Nanoarchaeia archaeon]
MPLRKAAAYSKKHVVPYTRKSKSRKNSFIKNVPHSKLTKMRMGNIKAYQEGRYPIVLSIKTKENITLRDNAIESVRQFLNRFLFETFGKEYYFEVKVYPHHILRENKMLTGAGADRMQTGMTKAFGKTMGRAAIVKKEQTLFVIAVSDTKKEEKARKLISSIKARLPCAVRVETKK